MLGVTITEKFVYKTLPNGRVARIPKKRWLQRLKEKGDPYNDDCNFLSIDEQSVCKVPECTNLRAKESGVNKMTEAMGGKHQRECRRRSCRHEGRRFRQER